ncbi:hypothetical protein P8452_55952 [Trifolium repens]|nr:hypothetical protein P8452_55952 [Trifolium repens]
MNTRWGKSQKNKLQGLLMRRTSNHLPKATFNNQVHEMRRQKLTDNCVMSLDNYPKLPNADDTTLFWGVKSYNDLLLQTGLAGYAQTELLF